MKKSGWETAKNFIFCDTQGPGTIPKGWNWYIWTTGKAKLGQWFCSFDSRNTEVKWIILFIIYKRVSPGTCRVEVQAFRSIQHFGHVSWVSELWNTNPGVTRSRAALGMGQFSSLSEIKAICHSREILMPQLAVEWICIKFSNHPWTQRFCLIIYREYFSFSGKRKSQRRLEGQTMLKPRLWQGLLRILFHNTAK